MADLTNGTRIRHTGWDVTGKIRAMGDRTEIRWDDVFGEVEVSDEGVVFPEDIEVIDA